MKRARGESYLFGGIIDTGATFTCIDNSVVQLFGLEPVEKQLIHGIATGAKPVAGDIYLIDVRIYEPGTNELGYSGVEATISTLKHSFSMVCARYKGERGFERYVGWSVITKNLFSIARWQERKRRRSDAQADGILGPAAQAAE